MKPSPFIYHAPKTVYEVLTTLADLSGSDGRILAGGQSLVPMMAFRVVMPSDIIDINRVPEFRRLDLDGEALSIGATVRHAAFHEEAAPPPLGPLLSYVVKHIAHYVIRTRGTFCGSLSHADPASEWCLVAVTLDATLVAKSATGTRGIAAADYFQGLMTTALNADELLAEARIPLLPSDARWGFYEFNRRPGDFAMAMALAVYQVSGGVIVNPKIGVGAVESHPRRIVVAEEMLAGRKPTDDVFLAAASAAADAVMPIESDADVAAYRRSLVQTCVYRALQMAGQQS
jgi:carbon-monoxide dehydrogenase medium subunit